jgi:hypothetical protein
MRRIDAVAAVRALLAAGLTVYECSVLLRAHPRAIEVLID